ncbi:DUF2796 domain-containing protein [Alteromonas sp. ASW11-36]|uniref:DUF2796 domain-containing protein n=1 Tax=Alteromonas arenosi TaxID=3055817 RepID=A0ABT7SW83_9ALTE|nr:DUF2796 domain-containing protein [Alteromonas sp. ASW11-36]MDM7860433.1 DUF2796 domain-containing protein [Alteromonas sp. ASW11-36]
MKVVLNRLIPMCTLCLLGSATAIAQQPHVHGAGKLFVGQENQTWELMFEIPAANAIGFEHLPTSDAETARIKTYINAVENNKALVIAEAGCRLRGAEHAIDEVFLSAVDEHHEHDHDHDKHAHHHQDKHEHHDHDGHEHHGEHYSVEFTLTFTCENATNEFVINVFDGAFGLNELNTEWFTESGQGATTLTPASRTLKFDN